MASSVSSSGRDFSGGYGASSRGSRDRNSDRSDGGRSHRGSGSSRSRSNMGAVDSTNGGWAEQEDRDRRERSRHDGSDGWSYDRVWNERLSSGGSSSGGYSIGGNSLISRTISEKYKNMAAKSLSSASITDEDRKSLTEGEFGKSYSDNNCLSREEWSDVSSDQRIRDLADYDEYVARQKEKDGNAFGRAVANVLSANPSESLVEAGLKEGLGLVLSKAGTIRDKFTDKNPTLNNLTPTQRDFYEARRKEFRNAFNESMDSAWSRGKSGLATIGGIAAGALTGGMAAPTVGAALGTIADNSRYNTAMEYTANKLNSPVLHREIEKRNAAMREAAKARREMKALNGNSEPASKGILGTMHERLNTPAPTAEPVDYNEIPRLFNLWNNISIR